MKSIGGAVVTPRVLSYTHIVHNSVNGYPKFTNLEFTSNLEQFLLQDGNCNIVVIGHVDCYGIKRARELSIKSSGPHRDYDGGQICFIDDWLKPVVDLFATTTDTSISDREISSLHIKGQVEELKTIVKKEEERWGTDGLVTIVGLLYDDTATGTQPVQIAAREVRRRKKEA